MESKAILSALLLTAGAVSAPVAARAADVSQDAIDACIGAVRAEVGSGGGHLLSTEFSEANSLVMLQDQYGTVWKCLVSNDGIDPYIEVSDQAPVHAPAQPDFADGMSGGPDFWRINVHSTLNVHSEPSTASPSFAKLNRGMVVRNLGCQFSGGRKWCQVPIAPEDGASIGWVAGEYLVEAAGPATSPAPAATARPTTATERVQFAAGTNGQQRNGALSPGSSVRFILGAANMQTLEVSFVNTDPAITYQIFLPNGRLLLDQAPNTLPYQGQLFLSGDHVVEVINRGHGDARYAVWIGIW